MQKAEKRNFLCEQSAVIEEVKKTGARPLLLLHSCCAPCLTHAAEVLVDAFELSVYNYNPNIYPEAEYRRRSDEQRRYVADVYGSEVAFLEEEYDPGCFQKAIDGHEGDREGGERCEICFSLRLKKTAAAARKLGYEFFSTTLTLSRKKDAFLVNKSGEEAAGNATPRFLVSDFKKRGGQENASAISKRRGLYKQSYCGCLYSKGEKECFSTK